jgi:hypothetical protein
MKKLTLLNKNIKNILLNLTDYVYSPENLNRVRKGVVHKRDPRIKHLGYKDAYLHEALKYPVKEYGYPLDLHGIEIGYIPDPTLNKEVMDRVKNLNETLGFGYNSLCCFYPEEGYIGWHHNGNASGFNLLFTYSPTGNGWFSYYDLKTQKIVKMNDEPGWSAKVGYYGRDDSNPRIAPEWDKIFWHSAYTKEPRLTVSFVLNHNNMWNDLIDEIESE